MRERWAQLVHISNHLYNPYICILLNIYICTLSLNDLRYLWEQKSQSSSPRRIGWSYQTGVSTLSQSPQLLLSLCSLPQAVSSTVAASWGDDSPCFSSVTRWDAHPDTCNDGLGEIAGISSGICSWWFSYTYIQELVLEIIFYNNMLIYFIIYKLVI